MAKNGPDAQTLHQGDSHVQEKLAHHHRKRKWLRKKQRPWDQNALKKDGFNRHTRQHRVMGDHEAVEIGPKWPKFDYGLFAESFQNFAHGVGFHPV